MPGDAAADVLTSGGWRFLGSMFVRSPGSMSALSWTTGADTVNRRVRPCLPLHIPTELHITLAPQIFLVDSTRSTKQALKFHSRLEPTSTIKLL